RVVGGASGNTIGGTSAGARNLISGNTSTGIDFRDAGTSGNIVAGNYVGTDATASSALANNIGVNVVDGVSGNTIGGTTAGARNVISGNSFGVAIGGAGTTVNVGAGNYVGTNAAGN